jgi:hypothetical protein
LWFIVFSPSVVGISASVVWFVSTDTFTLGQGGGDAFRTNVVMRMRTARIVFHGEVAARTCANRLKFRPFESILTDRPRIFRIGEHF